MIEPYLFFNGCCEDVIEYYKEVLGAEVTYMMRYKESPDQEFVTPENENQVLHASLKIGGSHIMMSDGEENESGVFKGFSLSLGFGDLDSAKKCFDELVKDGELVTPFAETFWSPGFGVANDKFGVSWMVSVGEEK